MGREISFKVNSEVLLRDFLKEKVSGKALKKIKNDGYIYVNDIERTVRYLLEVDDLVKVVFPYERKGRQMKAIKGEIAIVFEDDYFLVINKQKGIPCIPNRHYSISLANYILYYYQQNSIQGTLHFINRLDKDTSGLLLVSKYRHESYLVLHEPMIRKYQCLVEGEVTKGGVIDAPIYREAASVKRSIDSRGKEAITLYQPVSSSKLKSEIVCELLTGRTHQIRVHMAHIGHPIVGDSLYGNRVIDSDGQMLHSYYLSFYHPYEKKRKSFEHRININTVEDIQ